MEDDSANSSRVESSNENPPEEEGNRMSHIMEPLYDDNYQNDNYQNENLNGDSKENNSIEEERGEEVSQQGGDKN
jgi:hypothetical protein